jgi:putative hemolysin
MDRTPPDMLLRESGLLASFRHHLSLKFATSASEVREAQRLRYKVFAEEMRARLPSREPGIDCDSFDPYCDHLLVRDTSTNEVVGTYRVLSGSQAKRLGRLYSDEEFDLVRLAHLRDRMVEVGRSCVHADYRNGATIALLWSGLGEYMVEHGYDYLIGCASISMADGGHVAASVYNRIRQTHLSPVEYRAFPRCPLPLEALNGTLAAATPPLIKGYLRLGAYVCGEPAWDPDFNTADLLILLPLSRLTPRYRKHFLKE